MYILLMKLKKVIRNLISDEFIISRQFFDTFNRPIDFYHPKTFNEKLQIQKLYDRNPKMTELADKYEVRKYVASKGHKKILNDLYGVYDRPEDIDFDILPKDFVIKCNHSWDTNIICKDKSLLKEKDIIQQVNEWMNHNHYHTYREWSYKNIKPRVTIERYLSSPLKDYKLFCFMGTPTYIQVDSDRYDDHALDIYDMAWNRLECKKGGNSQSSCPEIRPAFFDDMVRAAKDLSSDFNFCRVDFFANTEGFYFAEITFYPGAGLSPFDPEAYDSLFGSHLDITDVYIPLFSRINISIIYFMEKLIDLTKLKKLS